MSADNYMLIRKVGGRFAVTMEFASDDKAGPVDYEPDEDGRMRTRWFDTAEEALTYAGSKWTEYGIEFDDRDLDSLIALSKPAQEAHQ